MLRILLVTAQPEAIQLFTEALSERPGVQLAQVDSGTKALSTVRKDSPHLVVIDSDLPDTKPSELIPELLMVNAMINTAVLSPLAEDEFHEASEGLGVLMRLPPNPGRDEAAQLLNKLQRVLGL